MNSSEKFTKEYSTWARRSWNETINGYGDSVFDHLNLEARIKGWNLIQPKATALLSNKKMKSILQRTNKPTEIRKEIIQMMDRAITNGNRLGSRNYLKKNRKLITKLKNGQGDGNRQERSKERARNFANKIAEQMKTDPKEGWKYITGKALVKDNFKDRIIFEAKQHWKDCTHMEETTPRPQPRFDWNRTKTSKNQMIFIYITHIKCTNSRLLPTLKDKTINKQFRFFLLFW
jgi:hypothetical protein